jgi:hypothetical protein
MVAVGFDFHLVASSTKFLNFFLVALSTVKAYIHIKRD